MKQFFAVIASSALMFSCGKKETGCSPMLVASENAQLVAYCNANGITYTEHPSGLLYQIIESGTGISPTGASTVSVVYTGKHLDNTNFEAQANPLSFQLGGSLIDGWKIGLPLIKKGGRIKLVIPSALAYSCAGRPKDTGGGYIIKPNEPIFFDITLHDVK